MPPILFSSNVCCAFKRESKDGKTEDVTAFSLDVPTRLRMDSFPRICKRKPNFTESENLYLVQEFEKHKTILNSKLTSMETNRGKQNVWQEICIGLNTLNNNEGKGERTVKEIRRKWKNMVTSAKRHAKQLKVTSKEPNGRSLKPLSALSQKIIEMKSESSNAVQSSTGGDTVIVEIKTEQQEGGYCTESISKKGPLEVFYSTTEPGGDVVSPDNEQTNPCELSHSPSSGETSSCGSQMRTDKPGTGACEPHEIDDDESVVEEMSVPDKPRKRVGVYTRSTQLRKRSKIHSTRLQSELSELKREKLLLQIEKIKSEREKLGMEKEKLALEIEFWKKKVQSTK